VLDEVNRAIIGELRADGRRPYGRIAKSVGLSEAAVRQRVQKLRETGVIEIVAVTDPRQVGFNRQALVGIRAEGDTRRLADKLSSVPEIDYVVLCAGRFDVLVELVCVDDHHLLDVVNHLRALPGVHEAEPFVYLELAKQSYAWSR
jgi:Lrp/AsnC family transcriptional regulator for asnA, asnC and gidA